MTWAKGNTRGCGCAGSVIPTRLKTLASASCRYWTFASSRAHAACSSALSARAVAASCSAPKRFAAA